MKLLFWFIAIFSILWCVWFITGGPQKEDSNKAYVSYPNSEGGEMEKYGTIRTLDRLNRSQNQ